MIYDIMNLKTTGNSQFSKYGIKYLYHMTHKKNLPYILKHGLLCHEDAHDSGYNKKNIANSDVIARRERKIDPIYNQLVINYVPFYFRIKNPMLFVKRAIQDDIVILCYDPSLLLKEETIFTDGNAASDNTKFFNDISNLNKLNWECLNARYWHDFPDGKREKMAEVLVGGTKVRNNYLQKIYCYSNSTYYEIKKKLSYSTNSLPVERNQKLFF